MASNAAPAFLADGRGWGEIGRAQALQAMAANQLPNVLMNPVLLKPIDGRMRVQVDGVAVAQENWRSYANEFPIWPSLLINASRSRYRRIRLDVCIIEGAGSCVELNLVERDLSNLPLMNRHQAPWILVGDIDRGGIYAQVLEYGLAFADDVWDRCRAVVVNRLQGDVDFFG